MVVAERKPYENRICNRPLSGGRNLSCFRPERLPELHSSAAARRHRGTVHERAVRHTLSLGDFRISTCRWGASAGQPLRAVGGGHTSAGDREYSFVPCFDGPERTSVGPLRCCPVGGDLRRRSAGVRCIVPGPSQRRRLISQGCSSALKVRTAIRIYPW